MFIGPSLALTGQQLHRSSVQGLVAQLGLAPALSLDAGDRTSYGGTGQTWTDLSGGSRNFTRGADTSASTDDPTFNGTAGGLSASEFWSFDGADRFAQANANGAFENAHHKDGATRTFCAYLLPASLSAGQVIYGAINSGTNIGVSFLVTSAGTLRLQVGNGTSATSFTSTGALTASSAAFVLVSYTINGASFFLINGNAETFTATVSSPSASNATNAYSIGAAPNGTSPILSGGHLSIVGGFNAALSQAQAVALSTMIRQRGLN